MKLEWSRDRKTSIRNHQIIPDMERTREQEMRTAKKHLDIPEMRLHHPIESFVEGSRCEIAAPVVVISVSVRVEVTAEHRVP